MKKLLASTLLLAAAISAFAATRHIGPGQTYATLNAAAAIAQPGDTLLMHAGTYVGGLTITNLKGTANQWITIKNVPGETVVFEGGSNAIQFVEPAYLHIVGLIFQHQTGNGVNTDDGGTYDTPAHHVIFENCTFRDMSATGNNDLLKLSGLDFFEVRSCQFLNGAAGGSGIDMVGCHHGVIRGNRFEQMGSNAIQCKGGSEHVRIEANFFKNAGQRALNIGGSTGLQFFRPDTAHFEAARVKVFSNVFIGSQAPVAYVGAVEVEVAHNTIYRPEKWVLRILQETVDPTRFLECGDNSFRNNVVFLGANVSTQVNVGPNTRPQTFVFSNNLWFNGDNPNWNGPSLPATETNAILNANPLFVNPLNENFAISPGSPADGAGMFLGDPKQDFLGRFFANPPSVGAFEANPVSAVASPGVLALRIFPNPAADFLWVEYELAVPSAEILLEIFDSNGRRARLFSPGKQAAGWQQAQVPLQGLGAGEYFLKISVDGREAYFKKVILG